MTRSPRPARPARRAALVGLAALVAAGPLAGCATEDVDTPAADYRDGQETSSPSPSASSSSLPGGEVVVLAAASLRGVLTELGEQFEADNPGTTVTLSFAGSSDLAAQITAGAPADVFAAADERTMTTVVDAGAVAGEPEVFATNVLTVVTPPDDPGGVAGLADLARPGVEVVLCAPQVPCGAAAAGVEQEAGIDITPVSEEASVTDVLGRVEAGEADAGLVYVTDARAAAGRVREVPTPEAAGVVNRYPVAELAEAAQPELAAAFTDLVTGPEGRAALADAGFGAP